MWLGGILFAVGLVAAGSVWWVQHELDTVAIDHADVHLSFNGVKPRLVMKLSGNNPLPVAIEGSRPHVVVDAPGGGVRIDTHLDMTVSIPSGHFEVSLDLPPDQVRDVGLIVGRNPRQHEDDAGLSGDILVKVGPFKRRVAFRGKVRLAPRVWPWGD